MSDSRQTGLLLQLEANSSQQCEVARSAVQQALFQGGLDGLAFYAIPSMAMLIHAGLVVARNPLARTLTGYTTGPDEAQPLEDVIVEGWPYRAPLSGLSDSSGLSDAIRDTSQSHGRSAATARRLRFECALARRHGAPLEVSAAAETVLVGGERCTLLLMLEHDEPRRTTSTEFEGSFLEDLLDATPGATAVTHDGRVLYVNAEFTRMFDYSQGESVGQDLDPLVMPDGRLYESEMIEHELASTGRASLESQRKTRTGRTLEVSIVVSRLRLGGNARGQFITYHDIEKKKQEEARLRHTALHDGLTGLANRGLFLNRAELMLARLRRRPNRGFAVLFLDLDGFKEVNDLRGHAAGDLVLLEVAERLRRVVRPQDTVARLGGDEFALLLDEAGDEADMSHIADRLQVEISHPIKIGVQEARITASIGIALASAAYLGASTDSMLRDADQAMYAAKRAGKAAFRVCVLPGTNFD